MRGVLRLTAGVAGVVVAHVLAYAVTIPDGNLRSRVLSATGHSYWPAAQAAAIVAAIVLVAAAIGRGVLAVLRDPGAAPDVAVADDESFATRVGRLAAWQMALFAATESLERIRVGVSPAVLLHSRTFAMGVTVQLLVAALIVAVLWALERLTSRVVRALLNGVRWARPRSQYIRAVAMTGPSDIWGLSWPRGPPLLASP